MFRTAATFTALAAVTLAVLPGAAGAYAGPSAPSPIISTPGPTKLGIVTATQKTTLKGAITVKVRTYKQWRQPSGAVVRTTGVANLPVTIEVLGFNAGGSSEHVDHCQRVTDAQGYATCTVAAPATINGKPATSFLSQASYEVGSHQNWLYDFKSVTLVP